MKCSSMVIIWFSLFFILLISSWLKCLIELINFSSKLKSFSWVLFESSNHHHSSHSCLKFQSLLNHTSPLPFLIICRGQNITISLSLSSILSIKFFQTPLQFRVLLFKYFNNPSLSSLPYSLTFPISTVPLIFPKYSSDFVIPLLSTFRNSSQFLSISLLMTWIHLPKFTTHYYN